MSERLPWYHDHDYTAVCHAGDMDGLGCALLLELFTEVAGISFVDYPVPEDLGAEGKVVVCDLGLPPDSPAWQNPDLVVVDHHGAAPEGAKARLAVAHDDGDACATLLLFEHLNAWLDRQWRTTGAEFVAMVNAGDLHNTGSRLYPRSRCYTWLLNKVGIAKLFEIARANPARFIDLPQSFLEAVDIARQREDEEARRVAVAMQHAVERDGLPKFTVTWLVGGDTSEVLGGMAEDQGAPVVGLLLRQVDGMLRVPASIRDTKGRAREIAQAFGGGGHLDAAGFTIGLDQALALWRGGDPNE